MTNRSPFPAPFPEVRFLEDRWWSWSEILAEMRSPSGRLAGLGVYVVAFFSGRPAPSLQLPDKHVVYIGETHGRKASLAQRLSQFGTSAGFFERGQQDGHYGAWGVPKLLGKEPQRGLRCSFESFYFAPASVPAPNDATQRGGDWQGVYPPLMEAALIWQHVERHGAIPSLNASGRQVTGDDERARRVMVESISEADLEILLNTDLQGAAVSKAAGRAAEAIALAWGYRPTKTYEDARGACRHLGKGNWLYVSQEPDGALAIRIVGPGDECHFGPQSEREGEGPARDREGVRRLLDSLWQAYL